MERGREQAIYCIVDQLAVSTITSLISLVQIIFVKMLGQRLTTGCRWMLHTQTRQKDEKANLYINIL